MTPQEKRNQKLAERMIKNLERRHIKGFYCPTGQEAVKKISELIADGSSVTWGGTMTIRDLGIPEALKSRGTLEVLDRDLVETPEEKQAMYVRAFTTDVYLTSANGVCHNCNSPESICNYVHFLRNSPKERHLVVLVGENLGY